MTPTEPPPEQHKALHQQQHRSTQTRTSHTSPKFSLGHGELRTIVQDEFLPECTGSLRFICIHFFRDEFEQTHRPLPAASNPSLVLGWLSCYFSVDWCVNWLAWIEKRAEGRQFSKALIRLSVDGDFGHGCFVANWQIIITTAPSKLVVKKQNIVSCTKLTGDPVEW